MVEDDFYALLGVDRSADDKAIKAAYRRLAMECHPDRHGGCTDQEARFKAINECEAACPKEISMENIMLMNRQRHSSSRSDRCRRNPAKVSQR